MPDENKNGKVLGAVSVAMIGISAIFTLRNLPCIADSGYQSIFFFSVAMLLFFLPISMACAELGSRFPKQGGVYIWVSEAFGVRIGFVASWLEWINNTLYFTMILSLMIFICDHICVHILQTKISKLNQLLLMLGFFWSMTIFNFFPLKYSSLFSSMGTILGAMIPAVVLISVAIYTFLNGKSHLPPPTMVMPDSNLGNVAKFSLAMAALTGIEISSYHIPNIKNPRKTYPKAMLLTALIIFSLYILSTLSIAVLVPADILDVSQGSIQAIECLGNKSVVCAVEIMMLIGMASYLNTWIISPLKGLMIAGQRGFFPKNLVKNNKHGSPQRLLIVQGVLVSFMVIAFVFINSPEAAFWCIEIVSSQLLMIMYILVFAACIQLHFMKPKEESDGYKIPGGRYVFFTVILIGIFSCVVSLLLALIKPENITTINFSSKKYAITIIGVTICLILPGFLLPVRTKIGLHKYNWTKQCSMGIAKLLGWEIHNITPPTACQKAIVILAPHTSNWDFFYGMLFKFSYPDLKIRFAIKKEVMFFPLSYIMKALGAIPIDRNKTGLKGGNNMVSIMADMINDSDSILLMIAPEGTRGYAKRWKTGFYRLSETTKLPIILGYINYAKKQMGLGPMCYPTGSIEKDIADIQDFYRGISGKYPEQGVI
ncbi:amino acid permease [Cardinium endosymbiont of Culicoides punctatus]|uniref:amino acid permease n=1 Tax=Cardinium endosymbiont of Culicoides punctatus TaxID=2304601 RepID=UPI001058E4FB|nr:amino acid permease [Cardinium endosymbiont of Culicoides punctatus]TDG95349.1 putative glutamate/gamma-aminobutyrate antiporter [Cardinium endosymbiont of Culicoides punctatus]